MTTMALSRAGVTPLLRRPHLFDATRVITDDSTQIWLDGTPAYVGASSQIGGAVDSFMDEASPVVRLVDRVLRDAGVARVIRSVDAAYARVLVDTAPGPSSDEMDAVDAVSYLRSCLGVSQRAIEQATGIKHRTLQYWKKNPEAKPRAGSLGQLWTLLSAVEDLNNYLGDKPVAVWLKERPGRLESLKAGQFRRLVDLETAALRSDVASIPVITFDSNTVEPVPSALRPVGTGYDAWSIDGEAPRIVLD